MPANTKIFISHTHEDNALCVPLLAALDAWQADYWFDTEQLDAGQQFSERIQRALQDRAIFLRICTPAAQRSYWMSRELEAVRGLQSTGAQQQRVIVHLLLQPGYAVDAADQRDIIIDATHVTQGQEFQTLRKALGIASPDSRMSRRAALGLGVTSIAAVAAVATAGGIFLNRPRTTATATFAPTTQLTTATPQPSASRVRWFFYGNQTTDGQTIHFAAANGNVYVATDGGVYALKAQDGSTIWSHTPTYFTAQSTPAIGSDTVYCHGSDPLLGNSLYALSMSDGSQRWLQTYDTSTLGFGLFASRPVLANGNVYFQYNEKLYAVNATTGAVSWSTQLGFAAAQSYPSKTPLAVGPNLIYVGQSDGNFVAYSAAQGSQVWSFPTGGNIEMTPTYNAGVVYFVSDANTLYALNGQTGALLWKITIEINLTSRPLVANGVVYLASQGFENPLIAVDAKTGKLIWSVKPDTQANFADTVGSDLGVGIALNGNTLYVESNSNSILYAVDAQAGKLQWWYRTAGLVSEASESLDVSDGNVYWVGGDNSATLYALSVG